MNQNFQLSNVRLQTQRFAGSLHRVEDTPAALAQDVLPLDQLVVVLGRDRRVAGHAVVLPHRRQGVLAAGGDQPEVMGPHVFAEGLLG